MAPLSGDRKTSIEPAGDIATYPVATATTIYLGSLVCLNSSGYAVPAADSAGFKFLGVAETGAINAGANGAMDVKVRRHGVAHVVAAGLTVADVGKPLYIADDQTVQLAAANVLAGTLAYFASATDAPLDLEGRLSVQADPGSLFTIEAFCAGTVPETETTIRDNFEWPKAFKVLRGYADALTAPGSTETCTIKITDGTSPQTFDLAGTDKHAEDEAIDQIYSANADIDVTVVNSSGASTANVQVTFVCQTII